MRPHSEHSVSVHHLVFFPFCSAYLCNGVISLFSSFFLIGIFGHLAKGQVDTFTVLHWDKTTRVCTNCHTKCSIVLAVSLRLYLKSLQKALWTVSRLLSIKSILFLFNNTGVSLCNYDVQWLLTPCRCARPALVGCLAKRELSFHVDQLAWRTNGENAVRRRYNKCYRDYFSCIESNFCVHFWLAATLLIIPADHT